MSESNRSNSSQRWLTEHFNDSYVKQAKSEGYRSRSAFKLVEIQKKDRIIKIKDLEKISEGKKEIDLTALGFTKLLSDGEISKPLIIKIRNLKIMKKCIKIKPQINAEIRRFILMGVAKIRAIMKASCM